MNGKTVIRASSLPSYGDCGLRTAAKAYAMEFAEQGYELRSIPPAVGAAVGTGIHHAAAYILRGKMETGELTSSEAATEVAITQFREEVESGAVWDDTTPTNEVAEKQIGRMVRAYLNGIAANIEPAEVELYLEADAGDGFMLSGHIDVVEVIQALDDLKTGALARPYQAQLGGYSLLRRSEGKPVTSLNIDFMRRTPRTKPQDMPVRESYAISAAEKAAHHAVRRIKADVTNFRETGETWAFPANPMSLMCRDKYCPAWGTQACNVWRQK